MPLSVALFGAGRIGHVHAKAVHDHPELRLAFVVDPWAEGARALAEQYGAEPLADVDDLAAAGPVDAAVIGSPTPTHTDLIIRCTELGIPVLCEKPIALDSADVDACRERIAGSSVPVMLGFNRRFDPSFAEIRRRVEAGEIGALQQLTIVSRDPAPAPIEYLRTSGGIFRDMSIHDLDMARFFVPEIESVSATGTAFSPDIAEIGDHDSVVISLQGRGGELVTIVNSRQCAAGYDQRLEAFGPRGALSAENLRTTTVRFSGEAGTEQQGPFLPFFLERYAAAYREELATFVRLVQGEEVSYPGFEDGAMALRLADACEESLRTGRRVLIAPSSETPLDQP